MANIDINMIEQFFRVAQKFHEKEMSLADCLLTLERQGVDTKSASGYIYVYSNLVSGKLFTRTINAMATEYFLTEIFKTKGLNVLNNALLSLSLHIDYYENKTNTNVKKGREILSKYTDLYGIESSDYFGENFDDGKFFEGALKKVQVNLYERNSFARQKCIEYHGTACKVCDFNFSNVYGELGKNFIHVHHVIEISTIKKEYEIDYKTDLMPVCPNCHAMLHKKNPAYSIDELKGIINKI